MSYSSSSSSSGFDKAKLGYFEMNHFSGDKNKFMRFKDEVTTAIFNHKGEPGVELVFTEWPEIPDQPGEFELPAKFRRKAELESLDGVQVAADLDAAGSRHRNFDDNSSYGANAQ